MTRRSRRVLRRIVVVGASIAGVSAVDSIRAEAFDGDIVLAGDEPCGAYARPPLSKAVLCGVDSADSVLLPALGTDIDVRVATAAGSLDLRRRTVTLGARPSRSTGS